MYSMERLFRLRFYTADGQILSSIVKALDSASAISILKEHDRLFQNGTLLDVVSTEDTGARYAIEAA